MSILEVCQSRSEEASQHYKAFLINKAGDYDLYRGIYRSTARTNRNFIRRPELFSFIQSDVARKVNIAFGATPPIEFDGIDPAIASKNSALVSKQLDDCNSFTKAMDVCLMADIYGTGFYKWNWKTLRRKGKFRALEVDELTGEQQEVVKEGTFTYFNGPNWEPLDFLDVMPQPGPHTMEDIRWCKIRYPMDIQTIEDYAQIGIFDQTAVDALKATGNPSVQVADEYTARANLFRSQHQINAWQSEKYATNVLCYDIIGYFPDEFCTSDGIKFRIVTIANDRVVLRNRPFPHWDGKMNVGAFAPMRDPHYIYGVGKIEICKKIAYLADKYESLKADGMDFAMDPPTFYNQSLDLNEETLYMKAGRYYGLNGPVGEDQIRQFRPEMSGIIAAMGENRELSRLMQQGTGMVEDTMMGLTGSDRQTKAEFLGRQENVMTRQFLEARLLEKQMIEPIGNAFRALNAQFLKVPMELRRLGQDSMVDPNTGLPLPPEAITIDLDDMAPDYKARAVGVTQFASKSQRREDFMGLLQTIGMNPVAPAAVAWAQMLRYTFKMYDMPNVDQFIVQQQLPAINQLALQSGKDPSEIVGLTRDPNALALALQGGV